VDAGVAARACSAGGAGVGVGAGAAELQPATAISNMARRQRWRIERQSSIDLGKGHYNGGDYELLTMSY
jgi:hypothetical protein